MLTGVLSACSPAGNEGFMRRVETDFRYKQELLPGAICSGYSTNR